MIDIRELRRDPDAYLARLARKGAERLGGELLEIDVAWRRETANVESLRAEQKRSGKPSPDDLSDRAAKKQQLQKAQALLTDLESRRKDLLDRIPNPPADDVPDGGKDAFNIYEVERDGLYLAGTSEVPLAAFHAGEILDELPIRDVACSTCFRRESGAAGKDTRGMFRVHQFDKVEMFVYCSPDSSREEHERLLA